MKKITVFIKAIFIIATVIVTSSISVKIWSEKPETIEHSKEIIYNNAMTVQEFGEKNNLPDPVLKKLFQLKTKSDLNKKLQDFNYTQEEISSITKKAIVLQAEHDSKNWKKIFVKFGLWIIFLLIMFFTLRKIKLVNNYRIAFYALSVVLFGVILGADPGPMGTIKDAIVLFGFEKVIFPPRMIALVVFLLMVLIANKFICSWGCQAGTLQDLLFRINREKKNKSIIKQIKIPFVISNTIRITFFVIIIVAAFFWSYDAVESIDIFKIFKPGKLSVVGWSFVSVLLLSSLFIYRPWCHLLCPFGLVGWIIEKISIFNIKVDYDKCIACEACSKACPSPVMGSILKRDKIIPDCFSCGSCLEACPSGAIEFRKGKREVPPENKFKK